MQVLWPPSAQVGIQVSGKEGLKRQDNCQLQDGESNKKRVDAHGQ